MRERLYRLLVGRIPGIRDRYIRVRKEYKGRLQAFLYLLWLNIQYYLFFRRSLKTPVGCAVYEEIPLFQHAPESSRTWTESPEDFAERLKKYDVVSFDVFDTLLFRCCEQPTDVFYFVGMVLRYPDFKQMRVEAERKARKKKQLENGTVELTLSELWDILSKDTGIPKAEGMQAELEWEKRCCYANPYMQTVIRHLQKQKKRMFAVSDMYLGKQFLVPLLESCGYTGFSDILVSCDFGKSKCDGGLYQILRERLGDGKSCVHIGDHRYADYFQAIRHGLAAFHYPNVNQMGAPYRVRDLSLMTGSIYRGLVNARLYAGGERISREYEYGYIYGGLFVIGYCRFIHACRKQLAADKILFFSRDGWLLQKVYQVLYPAEKDDTVYAYWSRYAAVKLSAGYYRQEYLQRFLTHKADQHIPLQKIVESMELSDMLDPLCRSVGAAPETELTNKNIKAVTDYFIKEYGQILLHYKKQREAGKIYYKQLLAGCRSVAAVDIGWAGSGALMLDYMVNREWKLSCSVFGILAGTSSCYTPHSDSFEPFFTDGFLKSYLYSQQENRDLWKYHDPAQKHNLYWELLLGAPEGSFQGFYPRSDGSIELRVKPLPEYAPQIREIHKGAMDFVKQFLTAEQRLGFCFSISGRDAYAPMIPVLNRKNKKFAEGLEAFLDETNIG